MYHDIYYVYSITISNGALISRNLFLCMPLHLLFSFFIGKTISSQYEFTPQTSMLWLYLLNSLCPERDLNKLNLCRLNEMCLSFMLENVPKRFLDSATPFSKQVPSAKICKLWLRNSQLVHPSAHLFLPLSYLCVCWSESAHLLLLLCSLRGETLLRARKNSSQLAVSRYVEPYRTVRVAAI